MKPRRATFYRSYGKRMLDLAISVPTAIAVAPLAATTGLAIVATMGRPILFRQERLGKNGRRFRLTKFRTMTDERDSAGRRLEDARRLTSLGRFLRRTSLDEIPTLWNVICGEMSLVGPRPLLAKYETRYSREQAGRHDVRPGVTGWAQINGRNTLSWDDKFRLDLEYADELSLPFDIRILAVTLWKVLSQDGVSAAAHATMPEFQGQGEE